MIRMFKKMMCYFPFRGWSTKVCVIKDHLLGLWLSSADLHTHTNSIFPSPKERNWVKLPSKEEKIWWLKPPKMVIFSCISLVSQIKKARWLCPLNNLVKKKNSLCAVWAVGITGIMQSLNDPAKEKTYQTFIWEAAMRHQDSVLLC